MRQHRRQQLREYAAGVPVCPSSGSPAGPFVPVPSPRRGPGIQQSGNQELSERIPAAREREEERPRPSVYDIPDDENDDDLMGFKGLLIPSATVRVEGGSPFRALWIRMRFVMPQSLVHGTFGIEPPTRKLPRSYGKQASLFAPRMDGLDPSLASDGQQTSRRGHLCFRISRCPASLLSVISLPSVKTRL